MLPFIDWDNIVSLFFATNLLDCLFILFQPRQASSCQTSATLQFPLDSSQNILIGFSRKHLVEKNYLISAHNDWGLILGVY